MTIIPASRSPLQIALAGWMSCASFMNGIECIGTDVDGSKGAQPAITTKQTSPIQIIPAGSQVTSVSASEFHTCVTRNSGVQCWGSNFYGQLGDGTTSTKYTPNWIIPVGSLVNSVETSYSYTCALSQGGYSCWGSNSNGLFGNEMQVSTQRPSVVKPSNSSVTSLGNSKYIQYHSCAAINGGVQCWGSNQYGALGNGSTGLSGEYTLSPFQTIATGSQATQVASETYSSCAVVNGGVRCWGTNTTAQLGDGTTTTRLNPVITIADNSGATKVSMANGAACAIVNGGLKCWGRGDFYLTGILPVATQLTPVQTIPANSNVTDVSVSEYHACAVVDGGVKCWGLNLYGQVGGVVFSQYTPQEVIPAGSLATAVASGPYHTCAVVDGGVKCWGNTEGGRLGNRGNYSATAPSWINLLTPP